MVKRGYVLNLIILCGCRLTSQHNLKYTSSVGLCSRVFLANESMIPASFWQHHIHSLSLLELVCTTETHTHLHQVHAHFSSAPIVNMQSRPEGHILFVVLPVGLSYVSYFSCVKGPTHTDLIPLVLFKAQLSKGTGQIMLG